MSATSRCASFFMVIVLLLGAGPSPGVAGGAPAIPDTDVVRLPGHLPWMARKQFDRGEAPASLKLSDLDIVLSKTPAQESELKSFLAAVNDPRSPQYHHWLSPAEYGRRFGASDATLKAVTDWLMSSGLKPGTIPEGRGHVPFLGGRSQIESAFRTEIHLFRVDGASHYSNVTAPAVPQALAPLIKAIRGLNDFHPKPGVHAAPAVTIPTNSVLGPNYLGVGDFAVIYNMNPLYQKLLFGQGVTVAIAAQSDIDPSILQTYWTAFGVSGGQLGLANQQFTSMPVPAASGGSDPGKTNDGNETEAYLDTEIVGGIAPGAAIILVRDKSAGAAAQYVIDTNLSAILNISFGSCEQSEKSANAAVESMYQQAVAQGMTVLVSTGDTGVAACDSATGVSTKGYAVNGLASTPYNIGVGGTEFDLNQLTAQNWSGTALPTLTTAQSYIPETAWNESCASPTLAAYFMAQGLIASADPVTLCNTAILGNGANQFLTNLGGGGGLSSCTTSDSTTGDCKGGYAQPAWQSNVPGITNFGARALPDIALPATHWIACDQTNTTCDPTSGSFIILYGTSAAAPAAAAIIAILDQTQITSANQDGRQGLLADRLYSIAGAEWSSASTLSSCNSSLGSGVAANCVFYDITTGNNDQPCLLDTYASSESLPASTCSGVAGGYGVMVQGSTSDYSAGAGFDLATGLGSLNASNLINAVDGLDPPTGLKAQAAGTTVTLTWTADSAATSFNVYQGNAAGMESSTPAQSGATGVTTTVTGLKNGQTFFFTISATTPYGTSASSNEASATIAPAAPSGLTAAVANKIVTLSWTASSGATSYNVYQGAGAGAEGATPVQSGITNTTTTVSGLTAGQPYYFTVTAINSGGASAASAEASATIPAPSSGGGGTLGWLALVGLLGAVARRSITTT